MKWRTPIAPGVPAVGDSRIVTRFAWWPRKCIDEHTYWLESIHVNQEFQEWEEPLVGSSCVLMIPCDGWRTIAYLGWLTIDTRVWNNK